VKIFRNTLFCVFLLALSACGTTTTRGLSIVTNSGIDPQADPSDPNLYTITVDFNTFSTAYDIEENLNRQVFNLTEARDYSSSKVLGRECNRLLQRCTYRVAFSK
jgi:hypothetical protein